MEVYLRVRKWRWCLVAKLQYKQLKVCVFISVFVSDCVIFWTLATFLSLGLLLGGHWSTVNWSLFTPLGFRISRWQTAGIHFVIFLSALNIYDSVCDYNVVLSRGWDITCVCVCVCVCVCACGRTCVRGFREAFVWVLNVMKMMLGWISEWMNEWCRI